MTEVTRAILKHYCQFCAEPFEATRRDARFCGPRCRVGNARSLKPYAPRPRREPRQRAVRDYSSKNYDYMKNPCVSCGKLRWAGKGSLPQGRCGDCRAAASQAKKAEIEARRIKSCAWCSETFHSEFGRIYCQESCRAEGFRAKHGKKFYPRDSATRRGYGLAHRQMRKVLLEAFTEGDPCGLCHEPMLDSDDLDLDHSDPAARLRGEPGDRLTHSTCNRRDGGRRARRSKALA